MHLKQYREAADDFEHVLQLDPTNKKAQDHLNTLRSKHLKDDAGKGTRKGNRLHIVEVEGCEGEGEGEEESEGEQQKRMLQGLLKTLEKKRSKAREKDKEEEREKGREGEKKKKKSNGKVAKQNGKTEERGGKEERGKEGEGGTQATVVNGIPKKNGVSEETDSTGVQQVAENPLSKTTKMAETETATGEPDRPTDEEGASRQKTPPTIIQAPPPLPPDVQQAKEEGNQLFRGGQYNSASLKYSLAIHNLERGTCTCIYV